MPTIGCASLRLPVDPKNPASPKAKIPPSDATRWYPPGFGQLGGQPGGGGGGAVDTVRHPLQSPESPEGLVTMTSRGPGTASEAIVILATTCVAETHCTELTVTPSPNPRVGVSANL